MGLFGRKKRAERMADATALRQDITGEVDDDVSPEGLDELVGQLGEPGEEDGDWDVKVRHMSGWTAVATSDGRLEWEDYEADAPGPGRYLEGVSRAEVRRVFGLVAEGRLDEVHAMDWQTG